MEHRQLAIADSFEVVPTQHHDSRGVFLEQYRAGFVSTLAGNSFEIKQVNTSVSHCGVVRGIHFAEVPPGQAKFVTVPSGSILDFVVDLREGSETFGRWDSVLIDSEKRNAVYIGVGIGHAFVSLGDNTVVSYLVNEYYNPSREHAINPLDTDLALEFPAGMELSLSEKDLSAPSLADLVSASGLPTITAIAELQSQLSAGEKSLK